MSVFLLHRAHGFVVHTLQTRIKAGEDPLPDTADLVLIDAHEEALSADTLADLLRPLVQVCARDFCPVWNTIIVGQGLHAAGSGRSDNAFYHTRGESGQWLHYPVFCDARIGDGAHVAS